MDWQIPPIVNLIAIIVAGGVSIWAAFFNKKKEIVKETDEQESKLVALYKGMNQALDLRVAELERKVTEMSNEITRLRQEKDLIQADKNALAAVLQGRDAASMEMMKSSMQAVQNINEITPLVKELIERVRRIEAKG